jgi:hypothetical protein
VEPVRVCSEKRNYPPAEREAFYIRDARRVPSELTSGFSERRQVNVPLEATIIAASLQSLVRRLCVVVPLSGPSLYNEVTSEIQREI